MRRCMRSLKAVSRRYSWLRACSFMVVGVCGVAKLCVSVLTAKGRGLLCSDASWLAVVLQTKTHLMWGWLVGGFCGADVALCVGWLALAHFEFRVFFVDHVEAAFATYDFAVGGACFDRCSYFHCFLLLG